jgi:large subunit ribosomal protein L3
VTTLNLEVVAADAARGVLMVRGAVPGSAGGWVLVRDAVKRLALADLPFPAALRGDEVAAESEATPAAEVEEAPPAAEDGTPVVEEPKAETEGETSGEGGAA